MAFPGRCIVLFAAALASLVPARANAAIPEGETVFRLSLGPELDAWPNGIGGSAGLWVLRGRFVAGIHLRVQALRRMWDYDEQRPLGALAGAYGLQVGTILGRGIWSPYLLAGYDRVGSAPMDAEGAVSGGRTQQEFNLEAGVKVWSNPQSDSFVGLRWSFAFDRSSYSPPGPPLPMAALAMTVMF